MIFSNLIDELIHDIKNGSITAEQLITELKRALELETDTLRDELAFMEKFISDINLDKPSEIKNTRFKLNSDYLTDTIKPDEIEHSTYYYDFNRNRDETNWRKHPKF